MGTYASLLTVTEPLSQDATADTLSARMDSLVARLDSTITAPSPADTAGTDTTDILTGLSREVGQAGRLLAEGRWEEVLDQLYSGVGRLLINFFENLIGALFVFLLFYTAYRILKTLLTRVLDRSRRVEDSLQVLLLKTYRVVGLLFVGLMVLAQFDVDVTALLAGLSIVGIAVGFAARDTLENFISGITILIDKPFRLGDNIEVDTTFGTVEEITLRSTRLRTLDNEIMVMPNVQMITQKLINHTMLRTVRVEVPFGIAYKEYPQQAREAVLKITENDERINYDYAPQVIVSKMNDSSVDMALRFYITNPKLEIPIRFEYTEKVREALREADIEIPFPHLQLFIDEAKALESSFLMRPDTPPSFRKPKPPSA